MLILRDRLGLTDQVAVVPPTLAVLLSLCDGTRDLAALRNGFLLRTGLPLTPAQLEDIIARLDSALLLEGPRLAEAEAAALATYRSAPARTPVLAGKAYPAEPEECRRVLLGYGQTHEAISGVAGGPIRGLISPHIDYQRGGPVYSRVWTRAAKTMSQVDVAVVLGTDHAGGPGRLTLTRQHYATPFGVLPTATDVVDAVAEAIGEPAAFGEELHHRSEHSIELAAVWLHHVLDGGSCQIVPVLCGSFQPYVAGDGDPFEQATLALALSALRRSLAGRRTLIVAAADLAHVGPAFGDERPFVAADRERLAAMDARLLGAVCSGDPAALIAGVREDQDRRRVCGLPPIYVALQLLGETAGEVVGYAQCPADQDGYSWVSVAGVVLR